MDRAVTDPAFRRRMLTEAVDEFLAGDLDAGKAMLRDFIRRAPAGGPVEERNYSWLTRRLP